MTENNESIETIDTSNEVQNSETQVKLEEKAILTEEQEINGLKAVHKYLSEFDRIPGSSTSSWAQMLDTVAVVANSLINKANSSLDNKEVPAASDAN